MDIRIKNVIRIYNFIRSDDTVHHAAKFNAALAITPSICMSITVGPQAMKPGEWEEGKRKISKGLGGKAAPGRDKMRVIAVESP